MKKDKLHELINEEIFEIKFPSKKHEEKFALKLENNHFRTTSKQQKLKNILILAGSIAAILILLLTFMRTYNRVELRDFSSEMAQTQAYFETEIEAQIKQLEKKSGDKYEGLLGDVKIQLKKLEDDYISLTKEMHRQQNAVPILRAMIENYQQRINLLEDVLFQVQQLEALENIEVI